MKTKEEITSLLKAIRDDLTTIVCDSSLRCKGWEENNPKLDSLCVFAHVHGYKYMGEPFKFCPWCGKEITWRDKP